MRWQETVFQSFRLYAVTDIQGSSQGVLKKIEAAYRSGADIVQLRSKTMPAAEKVRLGIAIRNLANQMKKLYFMNDAFDLAFLTGAHGLHVGQDDLPPRLIRGLCRKWKRKLYLGLSTHSESQVRAAQREPVDYFAVGPVFKTPTKPHYGAVGLDLVERAGHIARKPWVAIGGIDEKNIQRVLEKGAARVAVVRAIFSASQPAAACRRLARLVKGDGV